jgi:hypothetical protein
MLLFPPMPLIFFSPSWQDKAIRQVSVAEWPFVEERVNLIVVPDRLA